MLVLPTESHVDQAAPEAEREVAEKSAVSAETTGLLERQKQRLDSQAQHAAQWVDSFFTTQTTRLKSPLHSFGSAPNSITDKNRVTKSASGSH